MAALAAFLARQPLRLCLGDLARRRPAPRTWWAAGSALVLGSVAVAATAAAAFRAVGAFWAPLALAASMLLVQLAYDARNRGRTLLPEVLGAAAPGALAAAVVRADGWGLAEAFALWAIVATRAIPSVLYVRARLRLDRGRETGTDPVWPSHVLAIGLVGFLVFAGLAPRLAAVAVALLTARTALGLSRWRSGTRPRQVGLAEIGIGIGFVALVALGYRLPG